MVQREYATVSAGDSLAEITSPWRVRDPRWARPAEIADAVQADRSQMFDDVKEPCFAWVLNRDAKPTF
jgi:hypothetical protein